jgi:hypothetical protein
MTTRWCQKAPSVVAVVVIVFLLILIISLWTAASNGAFSSQQQQRTSSGSSSSSGSEPDNYINFMKSNNETLTPRLQNSITRWLEGKSKFDIVLSLNEFLTISRCTHD